MFRVPRPAERLSDGAVAALSRGRAWHLKSAASRRFLNGGRYRDRTYGPYHVKVVLSR